MKWYKRDPNASLADMAGLTLEEVGGYNGVLDAYCARDGVLPDDDYLLSRILRCNPRTWRKVKISLFKLQMLSVENGSLTPRTGPETLKEARVYSEQQANAARMKAERSKNIKDNNAPPVPSTTTTTSTSTKKEDAPAKRRSLHPLADDWKPVGELTRAQAAELEKMRDWAKSNAARKADWEATFRNWLRRAGVPPVDTAKVVPIKGFFVLDDSPERAAWEAWGIKNGKAFPRGMKSGGWAFPSQWPPGYEHADHLGRETETESNSERTVEAGALGEYLRSAVQSNVLRIGSKGRVGA